MPSAADLPINTNASAMQMAQTIFGTGIDIRTASYTGSNASSGIYSNGDTVAPVLTPSDTGVILSTGRARDVTNDEDDDINESASTTGRMDTDGDSQLSALGGGTSYDAAIFEATFVPDGEVLTMQIVFSSEEYLEYVNSGFNDAVGIWVNGVAAELTVGDGDITINNINDETNSNLYLNNPEGNEVANTEMDGLTVTLTLKAPVEAGSINTIKIGIADIGDDQYDSNLLIAGNSVQVALIATDDAVEIEARTTETLDVLANDVGAPGVQLFITHINGEEVQPGESVMLSTGEIIKLNDDGTLSIQTDGPGVNTFTYQVEDSDGNTDTGFVEITTTPPCFVAGTAIVTQKGEVPVETLRPGHMVLTRDHGFQPITWVGASTRAATGQDAPIRFEAGALGQHDMVEFSPNHRILFKSPQAEMLFGETEVLVKAKHLVNGTTIRVREDHRPVTYVHILFSCHEIVRANGMDSESYHPGRETIASFDGETRAEILRLMPNLDALTGYGYGAAARVSLKRYETMALISVA